jgi:hypothetical protein
MWSMRMIVQPPHSSHKKNEVKPVGGGQQTGKLQIHHEETLLQSQASTSAVEASCMTESTATGTKSVASTTLSAKTTAPRHISIVSPSPSPIPCSGLHNSSQATTWRSSSRNITRSPSGRWLTIMKMMNPRTQSKGFCMIFPCLKTPKKVPGFLLC